MTTQRVLVGAGAAGVAWAREFDAPAVVIAVSGSAFEHDRAGDLLSALRRATHDYRMPDDGCASYRALYQRLATLEHDTHVHVHKESYRLFPAAIAAEGRDPKEFQ